VWVFNAPFCHLVSKKKLEKKSSIIICGRDGYSTSNIIISRHFFQCLDSTALFIIFFFFFDIFCFIKKEIKIRKPLQEKNFFLEKKNCFFLRKNGTDFFMV